MITVVDYGLGNVRAFLNVYKRLNIAATVARNADELSKATRIILPGVGAFDHAMELLQISGMRETLDELVMSKGIPVLGICVGMQILAGSSEEGRLPGLAWIDGSVRKFDESKIAHRTRLPHMGWNDVKANAGSRLFDGLGHNPLFYFLHSYYFHCVRSENILACAEYGDTFSCAVHSRNIYGVQFHPEKSHHDGARLLKNFAEI
jgi:glutamine amidotransferase